jgi:hypothetical protein
MHPLQVSAQFAAFTWFENTHADKNTRDALRFARDHWVDFLPNAHEGLGRLLLRIGSGRHKMRKRKLALAS